MRVDMAAMPFRMALQNLAVLLQFVAIEIDKLSGSVVGIVLYHDQLHSEGFGHKAEICLIIFFAFIFAVFLSLVIGLETRSGVERQASLARVRIAANVQVPDGTGDVQVLVLGAGI